MQFNQLSLRTLSITIMINLALISCANQNNSLNDLKNINFENNFLISGKFKASFADSKVSGYFKLKKNLDLIQLTIGKNYLVPEKDFFFYSGEQIDIKKLLGFQAYNNNKISSKLELSTGRLLEILSGKSNMGSDDWKVTYPQNLKKMGSSDLPEKIIITNNELKLEIIKSRYIE
jgi:hypothetical protein|tara:strand:+ start:118 stop:642 length:525 start_codon:yes stop_codon:yes gene_type:complete